MFVFSLKAEVGGYWFCYLNGGKVFFLQTVEEEEGGRRRRVSCDLLTPWLRDMWIEVTRFLSYSSLTHTHTHTASPPHFLHRTSIPCQVGAAGKNPPPNEHTHTLLLFSQENQPPPPLIFILCFLLRHAQACPRPAKLDFIQSKQT